MDQNQKITFSVKQLAQYLGRSEQTVRRWRNQGKILAIGDESIYFMDKDKAILVFDIEQVKLFIQKNPRLLDKATPEFKEILYGENWKNQTKDSDIMPKAASAAAFTLTSLLGGPALTTSAVVGLATYILNNMSKSANTQAEEKAVYEETLEEASIDAEKIAQQSYVYRLLLNREGEIKASIDTLLAEFNQIQKEKAVIEEEYKNK